MARLEIPSIVVHKGGRSESRPESPCTLVCEGGMPSLPASRQQQALAGGSSSSSDSDMIEAANVSSRELHRSASESGSSSSKGPNDTETKNYRNRANTKVKLLVRSHAMRESTSPPREPQNGGPSQSAPQSPQPAEGEPVRASSPQPQQQPSKKFAGSNSLSPNPSNTPKQQQQQQQINNNNEPIYNSNLNNQSPKQMRNSATSPTCRTSSRNGSSSPSQPAQQKGPVSPANNKSEGQQQQRSKNNVGSKCNNCAKNDRPVLLQTPISPSKSQSQKNAQNNHKNEQRRPNTLNVCQNQCSAQCGNTLSVNNRSNNRHKLRHQNSSSQGSYDSASPSLSRDSSTELYTDSTGIDLEQFIAETINRNQKDRTVLLKIEKDLIEFAKDRQKVSHKFPNMSSYNRMLVHRVAAYFGMEHNVDQSGLSVIVTRTKNMRIPDTRFKQHIRDDLLLTEEPRRSILKRDSSSFEDSFNFKSPDRMSGDYCRRSKSFEEREEEYERARRRIFKDSSGESSEVTSWPYWSSSESSDASARYRLLHPSDHSVRQARQLLKGESLDGRDSFRSNGLRPSVSKSFSFGGYTRGMLSRGDSVMSTHSAGARLMKQDSGASMCSRLSPSSSGYKSQSQRSDATISPSPSPSPIPSMTCNHSQIASQEIVSPEPNGQTVMWAVTSISSVPPGSVIINPQTNQPYTNPDGSLYRFDPDNPPKLFIEDMDARGTNAPSKHSEPSESQQRAASVTAGGKNENGKRQRSQTTKHNSHCSSSATTTTMTTAVATTATQVTNSATSPSLPFTPPPAPPPPPPPPPPPVLQPQQQQQQQQHIPQPQPQPQQQHQQQQQHQPQPQPQPSQQSAAPQQQPLVRAVAVQPCNHGQPVQPYATYLPTSEPYSQGVYPPAVAQQTVMMAPHPVHGQPPVQNTGQDDVFNQNHVYANYTLPVQQPPLPHSGDVTELSNYFMGMSIYDQRGATDSQAAPSHPYPQPPPPTTNQTLQNVQQMQPNYWQTSANQMPPQQAMYFVPPAGPAISVNQNPADRQQLSQQQRFPQSYSINLQTMTPPSQTNANYMGSYPVTYNSMPTVTPSPGEYSCQPPVHMVPAYYPGQSGIQPPVMYRVPTPPNTPTSSQIPSVPLMYVNSGSYPPPTMMPTGSFSHQVGPNGTSPAPPGAYMAPALVPNLVFRQNVPLVTGVRTSTPGSSQRASRSPTPAHEFFGGGSGDRSAQPQPRYPLPMYQGVHIVQGDMRLMHPGVTGNPRLQYAPVPSPPVVQGCPRPYRPSSYSSNASGGGGTPTSFDGRNQKIRKQRSKITTLPPTATRPNLYQSPSMSTLSSNAPKDMREAKPVEDNIM
ncbi:cAMP-regulated phosphoprotein 21 isoform X2 [Nasonia vitripennis]|uniref:R3H domain-containing protein 1 n=1 Tax=Nasonia vitripennis TaxID=7425 RepID=A0A7M7IM82_NASVI|nr:cAMP-regulated phosphoprotein 21 isoform X2 [Nasonia vitripennis]